MSETVDLSPVWFAEVAGPAVTRTFIAGMRGGGNEGRELVAAYGGPAVGYLIDLRNPLAAGRAVTRDGLGQVYRYAVPDEVDATVDRGVAHGLLARSPDGAITPTERGHEFLRDLFALNGRVLAERWRGQSIFVRRLNETLTRVLAAAAATGGGAWAVQAPPHEPDGTPDEVLLLNRLSTLRYHRADAHAAAWQAAGLTAADMVAMPWGTEWTPQRTAVEHDTNVRAATPYEALSAPERLRMLADLAALL